MINRILERLEEERKTAYRTHERFEYKVDLGRAFGVERAIEIVQEVAKEYAEKPKAPSRCDTCTHYITDEVPPMCYLCCKGIEDNYKQKGE